MSEKFSQNPQTDAPDLTRKALEAQIKAFETRRELSTERTTQQNENDDFLDKLEAFVRQHRVNQSAQRTFHAANDQELTLLEDRAKAASEEALSSLQSSVRQEVQPAMRAAEPGPSQFVVTSDHISRMARQSANMPQVLEGLQRVVDGVGGYQSQMILTKLCFDAMLGFSREQQVDIARQVLLAYEEQSKKPLTPPRSAAPSTATTTTTTSTTYRVDSPVRGTVETTTGQEAPRSQDPSSEEADSEEGEEEGAPTLIRTRELPQERPSRTRKPPKRLHEPVLNLRSSINIRSSSTPIRSTAAAAGQTATTGRSREVRSMSKQVSTPSPPTPDQLRRSRLSIESLTSPTSETPKQSTSQSFYHHSTPPHTDRQPQYHHHFPPQPQHPHYRHPPHHPNQQSYEEDPDTITITPTPMPTIWPPPPQSSGSQATSPSTPSSAKRKRTGSIEELLWPPEAEQRGSGTTNVIASTMPGGVGQQQGPSVPPIPISRAAKRARGS